MEFLACAPPFTTLNIGTGSTCALTPPRYWKSGRFALHGGRLRGRQRHREDRVGAEARLVGRAVEVDHGEVDRALVFGVEALEQVADLAVHVVHGVLHALAVPGLAPVAQFHGFVDAGRGARRRDGASRGARFEVDVDFDGRIASRVKDLASQDNFDRAHYAAPLGFDPQGY